MGDEGTASSVFPYCGCDMHCKSPEHDDTRPDSPEFHPRQVAVDYTQSPTPTPISTYCRGHAHDSIAGGHPPVLCSTAHIPRISASTTGYPWWVRMGVRQSCVHVSSVLLTTFLPLSLWTTNYKEYTRTTYTCLTKMPKAGVHCCAPAVENSHARISATLLPELHLNSSKC